MDARRPMSRYSSESVATGALPAGNAEHAIQVVSSGVRKVLLWSLQMLRRSGASATAHRGRIYNVAGAAADAFSQQYRPSGTTAAGTIFGVTEINKPCYTDAAGKLYFNADGDAADKFDYELWVEFLD